MNAWVLDDGKMCVGLCDNLYFGLVTYTDPNALRFADEQSAMNVLVGLGGLGMTMLHKRCKPAEHVWVG